ncbi:serine protease 58-like [Cotesia glomerata]|uniref:serine protease 58-like n=1 Tax=Cotesia glomerata TaxID=32391 RepID=UPI001D00DF4E|nr:serine protease 58-like [Cotesia glomerata]
MSIFLLIFFLIIFNINTFVNNQETDNFFPYLVQFYTIVPCGGILITPDWVLTAAQCLHNKRNSILVNVAGSNETAGEPIGVKATFIHPQFNMYSKVHDHRFNVALMKLYRPFNLQPLGFLNKTAGMLVNIGTSKSINTYNCCFIYGWDSIISSTIRVFTKAIQTISVQPRDKEACVNKINNVNIVCASGESRKQCAGNPGSPIVCNEPNGDNRVLGIASWTNFSLQCDDSSTYLNLTSFRSWINNLVSMDFEKNSSPSNYSSTTSLKVQVKYFYNTQKTPYNRKIHNFTTSTTKNTTKRNKYQDIERSDKDEGTTEDELSKIFPFYQVSSSNSIYPIYFLLILGHICSFNL